VGNATKGDVGRSRIAVSAAVCGKPVDLDVRDL
jgi:hypothetical protein